MTSAAQFIAKAASQIGVTEYPPNSNITKYGEWYGMNCEPWCDMFVSWCGAEVGASAEVGKFAYCPYHVNWFKQRGQWIDRNGTPRPGDVIFFAKYGTPCHVGIVESVANGLVTIEGNTSVSSNDNGGAVMRRYRTMGTEGSSWYVIGYGRPNWDSEVVPEISGTKEGDVLKPVSIPTGTYPIYRVYNPNSGEHFYTPSKGEYDHLCSIGWNGEGVAFNGSDTGCVVYRLYNPNSGTHMFTILYDEAAKLDGLGWIYEGVNFSVARNGNPVYRAYNPNDGHHHWTLNEAEYDSLVNAGWIGEGVAWYVA